MLGAGLYLRSRDDVDATLETNVSAAVSGIFRVHERVSLTAGLGRSVRTATVIERYSDRFPSTKFQVAAEFMGTPDLQPEKGLELDWGLLAQVDNGAIEVNAYFRDIDDYITVVLDDSLSKRLPLSPNTVFRYVNGEARFWGLELSSENRWTEMVETRVSLNYVWANDRSLDEPVFGIPPLEARARIRLRPWSSRSHWIELSGVHMTSQDRVATTRLERATEAWTRVDLRSRFALGAGAALSAGVENLGDVFYTTHLNALDPFAGNRVAERGRTFHVGIEYEF